MKRLPFIAAASLIALSAVGAAIALHTLASPAAHLVPNPLSRTWPGDKTFQWQIDNIPMPPHTGLRLILRTRQTSTDPHAHTPVGDEYLAPTLPDHKDVPSSTIVSTAGGTRSATVTVQLVDLGDLALPNLPSPLRCLATLDTNGTTFLRANESILDGDAFDGWAPLETPTWNNHELHLLTFYTSGPTGTHTCNLLLQQIPIPN
jgi:hypothetical protein